ncbi:MAG: Gfo/Idh/MocA family oxidoreductase [Clostridia bacterium]|nr:Gfo/Idh/MocA family oxidoreductase [Clostridia bacterium]
MRKVRTAVVGCGMISYIYIKNFLHLFSVIELAGVCDMNAASAAEKSALFHVPVLTMEQIKNDPSIELVVNLTGPAAHYAVIRELLEAGKNVFTEKMLCLDFEDGKALVALAKEKGVRLGVAPDTFLGAGLQTARFCIDRGMIGKVTSVRAAINRSQALNAEAFRFLRNPGGGFAYDMGVYYVTALLTLLGPVQQVTGFVVETKPHAPQLLYADPAETPWKTADNNLSVAALRFANGVVGTLHFDGESIDEERPSLVIYGTEGILSLGAPNDFNGSVRLLRNNTNEVELPFTHGFTGETLYGPETPADYGQHRGVGAAEMAWAILGERPHRASAELGLHTMELLLGIDRSSQTGRVYDMTTSFDLPAPLRSGYTDRVLGGSLRADAEASLMR